MKNVEISLPDDLARDAAEAGLLDPAQLEALLRASLKQMEDALASDGAITHRCCDDQRACVCRNMDHR